VHLATLILVAFAVLALNLPFGFWREGVQTFSWTWLAAVHLPIPFVVALRLASGLGWRLHTFPVIVGAYLLGQHLGGRLRRRRLVRQQRGF
jgi:hypothetical protein